MKGLNLKLTPEKGAALYEALDTIIYIGNDFASDKFTDENRENILAIFDQIKKYNPS
mgnify:FL=1